MIRKRETNITQLAAHSVMLGRRVLTQSDWPEPHGDMLPERGHLFLSHDVSPSALVHPLPALAMLAALCMLFTEYARRDIWISPRPTHMHILGVDEAHGHLLYETRPFVFSLVLVGRVTGYVTSLVLQLSPVFSPLGMRVQVMMQ